MDGTVHEILRVRRVKKRLEKAAAVLESRAPAPCPECVAEKDGPPRAGIGGALGGVGRGVQLGPGMTTSHISYIIIR